MSPVRACLGCGELIRHGSRCTDCTPRNGSTRHYRKLRAQVLHGDARCYVCGNPADQADHLTPVSKGGKDTMSNLRPICGPCNRDKSDRTEA